MNDTSTKKRGGGINSMLLADLKSLAGQLGIKGSGSMKKAQLVEAIKAHQAPEKPAQAAPEKPAEKAPQEKPAEKAPEQPAQQPAQERPKRERPQRDQPAQEQPKQEQPAQEAPPQRQREQRQPEQNRQERQERPQQDRQQDQRGQHQGNQGNQNNQPNQSQQDQDDQNDDGEEGGTRRNRRRRGRDRTRAGVAPSGQPQSSGGGGGGGGGGRGEPDTTILEDDVLVPAAGILDVLDNYAFVRTSGYLPGADDVYLSLSMVRRYGLRRGDAVVGQVRQPREGERKEKFNPMVRVDNVNGGDPEVAKHREDFTVAKPTHPTGRLRLETGPEDVVGRVLDLVAPLGKGQRGLIVSPAGAGKTSLLQSIASSVTRNFPESHLMVVLVDERPEEVTDFQKAVKGEVVASAFDRPPGDHTTLAELAIERAKRLVELGHDVVVLVDGLTRLARAYNLAATGQGKVLAGGVEAAALFPPKRFFGAARKLEEGGSLTIIATVQVDSGSATDELIFEELSGTANWRLRLSATAAEHGIDPPVEVAGSGTRHEDLLVGAQEQAILTPLRRTVAERGEAGLEALLERVRTTQTNIELLTQLQRTPL